MEDFKMKSTLIALLLLLCAAWGMNGGVQGGLADPGGLGFYAGGHLDPTEIVPNLLLHLPAEIMIVDNFTDFSAGAQARYCFTGKVGWFAGGGLRVHYSQHTIHNSFNDFNSDTHTGLGMDLTGGYYFDAGGFRISPELTIMVIDVQSLNAGVGFTF
jgi:hypothetical protein